MASASQEGLATGQLDSLDQSQVQQKETMMDLSIAAQSEALGTLMEEHKEDIKKAE